MELHSILFFAAILLFAGLGIIFMLRRDKKRRAASTDVEIG